jgi:hypothetical protein
LKRKIIYEIGDENLATSIISSTGGNKKIMKRLLKFSFKSIATTFR